MATAKPGKLRQVLAKNIRRWRNELGITQEELAHRARVHRTYMSSIERAQRNVAIDNIEKIAAALGVKPYQLLSDSGLTVRAARGGAIPKFIPSPRYV